MFQVLVGDLLLGVVTVEEDADALFDAWAQKQIDEALENDETIARVKQVFIDRMAAELTVWQSTRKLVRL